MKRIITFFLFSIPMILSAQKTHTVAAKESFYSLGRMYNVHPKELASFNNISFEKGLSIGQVIKIPAAGNAAPMPDVPKVSEVVNTTPAKTEAVKTIKASGNNPIYHTVAPKEGLYGISKKYNASIADIKKWNNLSSDGLTIGANLIVGYGAGEAKQVEEVVTAKPVPEVKQPVVKTPEVKEAEQPVVKEQPKAAVVKEVATERNPSEFNGGFFKASYSQQKGSGIQDKGLAGIFKSTSGWEDGKYYCLHNSAPAGSFVKITNPLNNKSVYAKVLDLIPDLKKNSGIIISLSNAAASELGVSTSGFECVLNY